MEASEIKLSVIVITYNHENYIRQALDSILNQKVNFKYEILVGDDASTDGTPDILKEYKKKYPERIRLKLWKRNMGPTKNDYFLKKHARGKYIAQLEGDDYWTDENKLQIQVGFLEKHTDYIGCTHEFQIIDQYGNEKKKLETYDVLNAWISPSRRFTIKDVEKWTMPGHTGTYVYRNFFTNGDFSILYKAHRFVGDRTMAMLLALQGDVYRINRTMSTYRFVKKDKGSNWFSLESSNLYTLYDFFYYIRRLEKYASSTFGMNINIKKEKHVDFEGTLSIFCSHPTMALFLCLLKMVRDSSHPIEYIWLWLSRLPYSLYKAKIMGAVLQTQNCRDFETDNIILRNSTWKQFEKEWKGKELVVFGAGANTKSFLDKYYYKYHPKFIVDNDSSRWGTAFRGLIIHPPQELKDYPRDNLVVLITVSEYMEQIGSQLEEMGIHCYFSFPNMEYKKPYYTLYKLVEAVKTKIKRQV